MGKIKPPFYSILAFVVLASAGNIVQAQGSNPAYKNMERVKYYAVNSGYTAKDGDTTFTINGNVVNASAYRKYTASSSDFDKCCPCILETYDINDVLLSESISCTDCYVGSYKEYYRSGKIKLSGQFRENNTGSWKNIYNRGLCNVPEGEWQYYNEAGQKAYAEFWENGTFIRQVPEQDSVEIWKTELFLGDSVVNAQVLSVDQVPQLRVKLYYKNRKQLGSALTYKITISAVGYKLITQTFSPAEFAKMDLAKMINASGFVPGTPHVSYYLTVYNNEKQLRNFRLEVKY